MGTFSLKLLCKRDAKGKFTEYEEGRVHLLGKKKTITEDAEMKE